MMMGQRGCHCVTVARQEKIKEASPRMEFPESIKGLFPKIPLEIQMLTQMSLGCSKNKVIFLGRLKLETPTTLIKKKHTLKVIESQSLLYPTIWPAMLSNICENFQCAQLDII